MMTDLLYYTIARRKAGGWYLIRRSDGVRIGYATTLREWMRFRRHMLEVTRWRR